MWVWVFELIKRGSSNNNTSISIDKTPSHAIAFIWRVHIAECVCLCTGMCAVYIKNKKKKVKPDIREIVVHKLWWMLNEKMNRWRMQQQIIDYSNTKKKL